jgi:hypothetical protein
MVTGFDGGVNTGESVARRGAEGEETQREEGGSFFAKALEGSLRSGETGRKKGGRKKGNHGWHGGHGWGGGGRDLGFEI